VLTRPGRFDRRLLAPYAPGHSIVGWVHLHHDAFAAALQGQFIGVVCQIDFGEVHLHPTQPALALPGLGKVRRLSTNVGDGVRGAQWHVDPEGVELALGINAEVVVQHRQHRVFGSTHHLSFEVEQRAQQKNLEQRDGF
jgi:hypothetical protein